MNLVIDRRNEAGQVRRNGNEEREGSTPVDPIPIPVTATGTIHGRHINRPTVDNIVVTNHDSSTRAKEDGVATHEGEETDGTGGTVRFQVFDAYPWCSPGKNFPGAQHPSADQSTNDLCCVSRRRARDMSQ
jgi:hypothetical protein